MKAEKVYFTVYSADSPESLPPDSRELIDRAIGASADAWSPYSKFSVGAALLLENGEILTGNNQENAAFPSGLCAERVVLYYAGANFPGIAVKKMAIAAAGNDRLPEDPVAPCGGCRQALLEAENRAGSPIEIIMYGTSGIRVVKSAAVLLPLPFSFKP